MLKGKCVVLGVTGLGDDLRAAVLRRQQEVMSGDIDLTSLELK